MIVETLGKRFAVPQVNLEEVVCIDEKNYVVENISGSPVLRLRNKLLPLVDLREALKMEQPDALLLEDSNSKDKEEENSLKVATSWWLRQTKTNMV